MVLKIKTVARILIVPLTLFTLYLVMMIIGKFMGLPSGDAMVLVVEEYFNKYGLWLVLIGALIEGFLLVGQYFPGGTIIFLGVATASGDPFKAFQVVLVVSLSFIVAYTLNYFVGKYGWYHIFIKFGLREGIERAKRRLERNKFNAVMVSYWEPNLASIMATAAGILQIPTLQFLIYNLIGVAIWNAFWGTLVYLLGKNALKLFGLKYILVVFAIWITVVLIKNYIQYLKRSKEE